MKLTHLIIFTFTAFAGCTQMANTAANSDTTVTTKPATDSLSYLAVGDSYTIGESVPQAESYPYQLKNMLGKNGLKVKDPHIIAVTGWTTDDLIEAINQSGVTNQKFNIITLLIGVNDQYQGKTVSSYRPKFVQLLNTAIKFAGGDKTRVFVISIPDYGVTPFAQGRGAEISPAIDEFNKVNHDESIRAGVHYLDITPESRLAATDLALIAGDGLHPSGKMYEDWVKLLAPMVAKTLRK